MRLEAILAVLAAGRGRQRIVRDGRCLEGTGARRRSIVGERGCLGLIGGAESRSRRSRVAGVVRERRRLRLVAVVCGLGIAGES